MKQYPEIILDGGVVPVEKNEFVIQDIASWVLRIGVIASVAIMLMGLAVSWYHGMPTVPQMKHLPFNDHFQALMGGVLQADGPSIIDLGILLLVLTPIVRVAVSLVLFMIVDKDWFYAFVTFVVLTLTVSSLLYLKHL